MLRIRMPAFLAQYRVLRTAFTAGCWTSYLLQRSLPNLAGPFPLAAARPSYLPCQES